MKDGHKQELGFSYPHRGRISKVNFSGTFQRNAQSTELNAFSRSREAEFAGLGIVCLDRFIPVFWGSAPLSGLASRHFNFNVIPSQMSLKKNGELISSSYLVFKENHSMLTYISSGGLLFTSAVSVVGLSVKLD